MDAFEAINTRRSIRKYQDRPVPEEHIQKMLSAAMMAPSAMNSQPWHFIVISDRQLLREIGENNPQAEMTKGAVSAILVCADVKLEEAAGNWPLDCSAAVQNLLREGARGEAAQFGVEGEREDAAHTEAAQEP